MELINTEEIEENGLIYIKETFSNGTIVKSLKSDQIPEEPERPMEPEIKSEYISKYELDAAYSEGVNSIG